MAVAALSTSAPVVETTAGRVRGRTIPEGLVFQGLRYAQAPAGVRRYTAPEPPRPWADVHDATRPGPDCPQLRAGRLGGALAAFESRQPAGDDMLCLNVWTPAADDARRPVMVWIHGGAFILGSGAAPIYDGAAFARHGVVLVTLNYRLHALGFLHLDELFAEARGTGNLAIADQLAALCWVQGNIARFGGDPGNVTIFGQSAGAGCVGALLGTPAADGLYRRAILQSGAASHALPAATATRIAQRVLDMLRVRDWAGLWHVAPRRIVLAAQRIFWLEAGRLLTADRALKLPFLPVVDGVTLSAPPIERVRAGARAGVDILVGTCGDEYRAFVAGLPPLVRSLLPSAPVAGEDLIAAYARRAPEASLRSVQTAIHGDHMFTIPAIRLAEAQHAAGGQAFMYRFTWPTPIRGGALGACHGVDVPFAFDTLHRARGLCGHRPPQELADATHGAWLRFAATGDPGWPRYDLGARSTMELGSRRRVVEDPRRTERLLWEGTW